MLLAEYWMHEIRNKRGADLMFVLQRVGGGS